MRIDKFLKNSRIIKRRTVAKEACEQGRILLNDKTAKPGAEVQEGDEIFVQFGNGSILHVRKSWHFWNPAGRGIAVKMYHGIEEKT